MSGGTEAGALAIKGPESAREEVPLRRSHGVRYLARFLATKHSWKGKYPRIFCVCPDSILTLNPTSFEVTNEWVYADLLDVTCSGTDTSGFTIQVKADTSSSSLAVLKSKTNKLTFASEHRMGHLLVTWGSKQQRVDTPGIDPRGPRAPPSP